MDNLTEFYQPSLTPKRENNFEKNTENDIVRSVLKTRFFDKLTLENLDLDIVSNGKRNRNEQFHKFNLFIKMMYENHRILMHDMVQFLEEDWFDYKSVLQCLNEENYFILREELQIKYHRKQKRSKLELLIEEE